VSPLGAAISLSGVALVLAFTRRRRIGQALLGIVLVALWIAATPAFATWINWRLESQIPFVGVEELPQADVVILLGGAPASRIVRALRIYSARKAPVILISGGDLPWQTGIVSDAQRIANFLVELGAPSSALVLETDSRTTRENAVNTVAVFKKHGWRKGLLVTSGAHMPRALAAFQKVGLDVVPAVGTPRNGPLEINSLFDILPDAGALAATTSAIKEMIGLRVYRLRGWA
jgi:uncharacterized SAM-binding protein YcdF (DUF218 family)